MRIAVPLAIPVALGVTLGTVYVTSSSGHADIRQSAFGRHFGTGGWRNRGLPGAAPSPTATTTASAPATPAAAGATATPTATPSASATTTAVAPASSFAGGPIATSQLGGLATAPVNGAGTAINMNQTAAQAAASMNCTLAVPANPLSAAGLATPWQLGDGCSMANAGTEGAFVEATILAPNGSLQVYNPLVVTAGTQPAVAPAPPQIAPGSAVIIDIGFNGTDLVLTGAGARQGNCVDALGQSVIGQVSACNAVNFYNAANAAIARGALTVPPAGTATDGQPCQTTRDFALIDQDQSDNVVSEYLVTGNGQTAQATTASKASLAGATVVTNGSDDGLLADFVDPANGCRPFTAPDTTNPNGNSASQALNELSARVNQKGVIAVTPPNDEMALVGGNMNIAKTNVYRSLVDQPLLAANTNPATVAASYCQNMVNIAPARNKLDMAKDAAFTSPVPAVGDNLATFMANRLAMSFTNLNCQSFGLSNPVNVTLNGSGVAIAATYNLTQQAVRGTATTMLRRTNPFAGQSSGTQATSPRRRRWQNPSGA